MQTVDCESVKMIHIHLMLPRILGPCNDLITIIVENNILLHRKCYLAKLRFLLYIISQV